MSQNRHFRAHGRRPVDLAGSLHRPSRQGIEAIRVVDLSLAGACVEVEEPLTPGMQVRLEIMAPTLRDLLVVPGRTVWSHKGKSGTRAGLFFEHQDQALAFALFKLIGAQSYED